MLSFTKFYLLSSARNYPSFFWIQVWQHLIYCALYCSYLKKLCWMDGTINLKPDRHGSESWLCCLLSVWLHASYRTSLNFIFSLIKKKKREKIIIWARSDSYDKIPQTGQLINKIILFLRVWRSKVQNQGAFRFSVIDDTFSLCSHKVKEARKLSGASSTKY